MTKRNDDSSPEHELEQALSRVLADIDEKGPISPHLRMLARKLQEALSQARRKH